MKALTITMKTVRETRAQAHSGPGPDVATEQVRGGQHAADDPHHVPAGCEHGQGTKIGRKVGDLGLRTGLEEGVAEQADQSEDQEGPVPGPSAPS